MKGRLPMKLPHQVWFLLSIFLNPHFVKFTVSVLGREERYTVKYTPLPEGVPEGEARGNS